MCVSSGYEICQGVSFMYVIAPLEATKKDYLLTASSSQAPLWAPEQQGAPGELDPCGGGGAG